MTLFTAFLTLLALAISFNALWHLTVTDPKRRRVFRLSTTDSTPDRPVETKRTLAILLVPGVFLALNAIWSGFLVWAAVVTVTGWGIAALPPSSPFFRESPLTVASTFLLRTAKRLKS